MSQFKIIELLKQTPEQWYTSTEIAKKLRSRKTSISANLTRLKRNKINCLEFKKERVISRSFNRIILFIKYKEIKE